ncbi:MAG TPA: hypothetical protein VJI52_04205 [Candidatus Nanoarchaeia archaeon]|nr:hypothetical protein [Candidatus Nanoarchaeia archaeon]
MAKKSAILYGIITLLLVLFLWQWVSNGSLINRLTNLNNQAALLQNYNGQLSKLSGIGALKSTHIHADIKVYINGKSIDFSQKKYQLATSYIHFEDGVGDVMHIHATGLAMRHLLKSLNGDFNNNCLALESQTSCSDGNKKLKFYVNGKQNNEFGYYVIQDLDKLLVSYGAENDSEIQKQLKSVTNLAPEYSASKDAE